MSESPHPDLAVYESLSTSLQSLIALSSPPDAEQVTRVALGRAFRELWSGLDGLAHSQNPPWRRLYGPHDPLVSVPWGSFPSWSDAAESLIETAVRRLWMCGYPAAADVVPSKEAVSSGVELMQELLSGGTTLNELILRIEQERDGVRAMLENAQPPADTPQPHADGPGAVGDTGGETAHRLVALLADHAGGVDLKGLACELDHRTTTNGKLTVLEHRCPALFQTATAKALAELCRCTTECIYQTAAWKENRGKAAPQRVFERNARLQERGQRLDAPRPE
ncbi:MAG: hypothetical protein GYA33_02715 [Thermogutta sp.]|nr:hypothetical protein [Thermogutta sp.]